MKEDMYTCTCNDNTISQVIQNCVETSKKNTLSSAPADLSHGEMAASLHDELGHVPAILLHSGAVLGAQHEVSNTRPLQQREGGGRGKEEVVGRRR